MKKNFTRGLIIFLLLLAAACSERQTDRDGIKVTNLREAEPNNKREEAQPVKNGTAAKGFIQEPKDQDWYQIQIPADSAAILRAKLTGVNELNLKLELFDSAGDELIEVDKNKEGKGEILTNYGLTTGTYFIRIRELWLKDKAKKSNDSTFYILQINLEPVTANCEMEPNNRGVEATEITPNEDMQGYLSPWHDEDWYKLSLPPESRYYMAISLSGLEDVDSRISVYDPIEALILQKDGESKGVGEIIPNLGIDATKEFYYIVIKGGKWHTNEEQAYQLRVDFVETEGLMEIEPNNRMVRATPLAENDTIRGFIETSKDVDWFELKNNDSTANILRLEALSVKKIDLAISVFNQDEEEIFTVNDAGEMEPEFIPNLGIMPNRTYYFKIHNKMKRGNAEDFYTLLTRTTRYYNDEEFEVNNSAETASLLLNNRSVTGYIHPGGDVDFYRLSLTQQANSQLDLKLQGILKVNTNLVLYDENLNELARAADRPAEETEKLSLRVNGGGIYYVKITGTKAAESNYRDKYRLQAVVRPVY